MLTDKKITFAAGNKVECNKNISGYVKANSIAGNKITEKMNNIELFNQIYEKYYKSIVSYFPNDLTAAKQRIWLKLLL